MIHKLGLFFSGGAVLLLALSLFTGSLLANSENVVSLSTKCKYEPVPAANEQKQPDSTLSISYNLPCSSLTVEQDVLYGFKYGVPTELNGTHQTTGELVYGDSVQPNLTQKGSLFFELNNRGKVSNEKIEKMEKLYFKLHWERSQKKPSLEAYHKSGNELKRSLKDGIYFDCEPIEFTKEK